MARKIAELLIKLGADILGVEKMSSDVRKQLRGLQKDVMEFGKSWSKYVTAPLAAAAAVSVRNADVQVQAEKRLLVALKGREDIQKRLMAQASEIQTRSTFGDEELIAQQAYLAALGLTESQIRATTEASVQLSSATGMTLDSAIKNLGKSFGGLLGELGEMDSRLKNLTVDQLRNGEAVKFVIENYKGYAEAAAKEGLGPFKQMLGLLSDLSEEIGKVLLPAIQKVSEVLKGWIKIFIDSPGYIKGFTVAIGGLLAAVGPLSLAFGGILKALPTIKAGFLALVGPVGWVTAAVTALVVEIGSLVAYGMRMRQTFVDSSVKRYLDSGKSLDELKKLRDEYEKIAAGEDINQSASEDSGDWWKKLLAGGLMYSVIPDSRRFIDGELQKQLVSKVGVFALAKASPEVRKLLLSGGLSPKKMAQSEIEALDKVIEMKELEARFAGLGDGGSGNNGAKETLGLLGELQKKISDLEAAKKKAASTYEIHNLNVEIKALNDELSRIQSLDTPIGYEPGRLFGGVTTLKFDPNAINPPESDWSKAKENFYANMQNFGASAYEQIIDIGQVMTQAFQSLAVNIGTALGDIFSGNGSLDSVLNLFTSTLGQFLVKLGSQLIATAEIVVKIKAALSSLGLAPWAAIAVGVAAIAAGTAMMNLFSGSNRGVALAKGGLAYGPTMALVGDNPGAGSDPEVIAPLSKLRQYGMGRQTIEFVGGRFALSGSDLVLAIRREDARIAYTNGL